MSNMAPASRMPDYCGVEIANLLGNICVHLGHLVKKGVIDEKHMIFLTHCLFKQPQSMELIDTYFLKFEQSGSSKPGVYGSYASPTHVRFAGHQSTRSDSQISTPSVRFEDLVTAVTSTDLKFGDVSIKVEEATTAFATLSNCVDPALNAVFEVTREGAETPATIKPAHANGIEAVTQIISHGVVPSTESSTTICYPEVKCIDALVSSTAVHAEIGGIEFPTPTVVDTATKDIETFVATHITTNAVDTLNTPTFHAEIQSLEASVDPIDADTEITAIDTPTTPIPSMPNHEDTQVVDSISDDEDGGSDFFSMPYDREANRSIYDDPPRSFPSNKSTSTATRFITDDSPEKFSKFLQRCDRLGIKRIISPTKDTVNAERLAGQRPVLAAAEVVAVVEAPNFNVSEDFRATDAPISSMIKEVVIAEKPKVEVAEHPKITNQIHIFENNIQTNSKPAQRGYGGVAVRYITEEGTFARDGSVEFQTVGLSKGVKPERMVSRHNSGVVVETLHYARGGLTGGGPRGDMKSLRFNAGERLKIKKMLGNGWYLARKLVGDDEYSTVRIFRMETDLKIASKTKLIGDTSASASRIIVRAPSPNQDFTWVPPHLRGINVIFPHVEVEVEPIIRKRYHEILYFDGRSPRLVSETATAVVN